MAEHEQQTLCRRIVQGCKRDPYFPALKEFEAPRELVQAFGDPDALRNDPNFTATIHACHAALIVHRAGDPVFELSPDIVHALRDTEVPNVPAEEIKLPFEGINVDFPKGTLAPPAHAVSRLLIFQAPGDRFRVVYHHDDRTNYLNFRPKEGTKLHDCIDDAMRRQWDDMADPEVIQKFRDETLYDNYWETDMFRLALNTVLYITSPESDSVEDKSHVHKIHQKLQGKKAGRKRDVLMNKLAKAKQTRRFIVGAKFRLSKEYQAKLTDTGRKWVLEHRVRVMGHFKMQPYGPGKEKRKRIWVAPYWKGPTFAEMVQKGYVVR